MIRIIKTAICLLFFGLASFPLLSQDSQPLLKKITLSQEEEFIGWAFDLAVTKEENFLMLDIQGKKIMLYDQTGRFIKSWRMIGQGPGEYQGGSRINFMDPYLGILDLPGRKLVIYRLDKSQDLEWVKNIHSQSQSFSNFQFYEDIVIFDGLIIEKSRQYYLQSHDLEETKNSLFLPAGLRLGLSPETNILERGNFHSNFARNWGLMWGYLDVYDGHIYSTWNGMAEIIKINMETKKWEVFSQKTNNYKQPEIRQRRQKEIDIEKRDQYASWVKGVFADNNIVGLIYLTYDWNKSCFVTFLQTYDENGIFQKENILEGGSGDYQELYFSVKYSRYTGCLYILITNEEDASVEILVYQIRE